MHPVRSMKSSNFELKLVSDGKRDLALAIQILLDEKGHDSAATHYAVDDGWLYLTCGTNLTNGPIGKLVKLAYALKHVALADFVSGWLDVPEREMSPSNDIDGDVSEGGFEIDGTQAYFDMLFRVRPQWREYHK